MRSFQAVVAGQLDGGQWAALLRGDTGILRIPGFLSPGRREAALRQLDGALFPAYDPIEECGGIDPVAHRQIQADHLAGSRPGEPPVSRRLGRTLYEYAARGTAEEYFKRVDEFEAARRAVFHPGADVIEEVLDLISRVTGNGAAVAEEPGFGRCYAGVIRDVHGRSRLHTDDARDETPQFAVGTLPSQLGVYIILDMPEQGGDLTVYEREHRAGDKAFRQGYGLDPRAVAGDAFVGITPRPGDLILFPDRNIHCVDACSGAGRRIKLQAHLGVRPDGDITCWS
jgi:hypothetical protein